MESELSLSISKTSEDDSRNKNNDISMVEITDKSIFNSDKNNYSFNKTPDTKKINKEKKIKKLKEAVVRKLNFDMPKNNAFNISKFKLKNGNKYPLLNKIILDYQHKPAEKKIKNNLITKRITKKIKINLNFKEINFHKNNSYKEHKKDFEEKCILINQNNYANNYNYMNLKKKKKNTSYNNIFNFNKFINPNLNSKDNLDIKIKTRDNSIEKEINKNKNKSKKEIKNKLSLSINNKEKNYIGKNYINYNKKSKYLIINALKRNNFYNILETSTKKSNTYLTSMNNSSILKTNNSNNDKHYNIESIKQFVYIKNKLKNKNIISSYNSANHSHRNTLSDYKTSNTKISKIYHKKNYLSTYNYSNSKKSLTTRVNLKKKDSKTRLLKKMLLIFGKKLYNPIKSRQDDDKTYKKYKLINNLKGINVVNDYGNQCKTSLERNKGKKSSFTSKIN